MGAEPPRASRAGAAAGLIFALAAALALNPQQPVVRPPHRPAPPLALDRVVRLDIEYDEHFRAQHGPAVGEAIREAVAIHNLEWRRYRREWFMVGALRLVPSGTERDASYQLARLLQRSSSEPDVIHVFVVGRPLEVYTTGAEPMPIGGLAYRGSDTVIVSATPGIGSELLAYYLFHELGHCWDAYDIPFGGGETTFGNKTRMTFRIDAGNEEIMEDAPGPLPRDAPRRAPALLRRRLFEARAAFGDKPFFGALHDLLLHEASPANPAYAAKREAVLRSAPTQTDTIREFLTRLEPTQEHLNDDRELRQHIAEHYWRANDAIADSDLDRAAIEIDAIRALADSAPDVHLLVGAVSKKIRRRR